MILLEKSNLFKALALGLSAFLLVSCGSSPQKSEDKAKDAEEVADKPVDDSEPDDDALSGSSGKPASAKIKAEPSFSTVPKKTGKMVSGLEFNQRNEFLGMTILKVSPEGIRLDTPTVSAVFPPKDVGPHVYNSVTGKTMLLTSKNSSFLQQASGMTGSGEEETKKAGTETIAGYKCTHYVVDRFVVNPKTKEKFHEWTTEVWATRDLPLPKQTIDDCSKLTMMPPSFGFPMRVVRHATPTEKEKKRGLKGRQRRVMIDTLSCKNAKFDKGEFELLTGFERVNDEMALMMSNEDDSDLTADLDEEKPVHR